MRASTARKCLAILWTAALPASASAIDWSSRIGFGWSQQDDWSPSVHDRSPLMLLDLGLRLRQVFSDPGTAWLLGDASYRLYDRKSNGVQVERSDTYTYQASGALFQHRASPFTLGFDASRVANDTSGAQGLFGSLTGDSGSVGAKLAIPERPQLSLAYGWNVSSATFPDLPDHDRTIQRLDAGSHHATSAFNLDARYSAEWSRGSWLADDYVVDNVYAETSASLDASTTFTLSDQYYRRSPTRSFDLALESELHALQASVRRAPEPREEQYGRYAYAHGLQAVPSLPSTETTSHTGEYWREFRFGTSAFSARPTASVSATIQRSGATETRTTGETVSALVRWYRQGADSVDEILGGPSLGLLQDASASDTFGYGGSLTLGTARTLLGLRTNGRYAITYGANLAGVRGWSLTQVATGSASGTFGGGTLSAQAQLAAARAESQLFGAFATRSIFLSSSYARGVHRLTGSLTIGSGIAGNPTDRFVGDGLLLPTPFNSHATYASLVASTGRRVGVAAYAGLNFGDTNAPGQPAMTQYGATAALAYVFAAFAVSLEDRITTYAYPSGDTTTNLLMFRLQRTFGDAF